MVESQFCPEKEMFAGEEGGGGFQDFQGGKLKKQHQKLTESNLPKPA